ncbi:hypothetical protein QQS21_006103 [Conoideocrella luteorostrata]|uniref:Calcineurin-like phosphoesterase domain-containing protein n=1 Tax=Conoideocrella luteorostrata TaxID=1105319 RepID=A0AAJ0FYK5_9HYPO|nr:hypothetical protein QQS21_006103 [Conoideocrella luteorostrata]
MSSRRNIFITTLVLAIALLIIILYSLRTTSIWPCSSKRPDIDAIPMSYGKNHRPKMDHLTLTANIPRRHLPTAHNDRRLIIIGDIHGMNIELGHLLDLARYNSSNDHVVTLGDMINKGPDSRGVLSRLMAMNVSAVRGNHEDHLLLALEEYQSRGTTIDDGSNVFEMRHRNRKILKVAKTLHPRQIEWLSNLPVILKAKPLQLYFVHGGLVPGVELEKQDPWAVMNMRTLVYPREELRRNLETFPNSSLHMKPEEHSQDDNETDEEEEKEQQTEIDVRKVIAIPIEDHSGEKWTKAWDRHQRRLAKSKRRTVMYGHDAKRGFIEGRYTVGLDSGCVRGGSLTGLIVRAKGKRGFAYTKIQVPCKPN